VQCTYQLQLDLGHLYQLELDPYLVLVQN